ncbi:hypothetical protein LEL_02544 [Akanthomyces lecanii RCEF 1005]|uniref:Uncharacterized protein n=1 Tax=Akanthomyces lecanii RCEF 1005 TaxID=1081108 RepID=A0A162KS70_CORDF|nr:hypothetical protein LEL_02544 [Akanthomyces lecanii RCEF 1005]
MTTALNINWVIDQLQDRFNTHGTILVRQALDSILQLQRDLEAANLNLATARSETDQLRTEMDKLQLELYRIHTGDIRVDRARPHSPRARGGLSASRARSHSRERSRSRRRSTPPDSTHVHWAEPVAVGASEAGRSANSAAATAGVRDRPSQSYHLSAQHLRDERRKREFLEERDRLSARFDLHSRPDPRSTHLPSFPWSGTGAPPPSSPAGHPATPVPHPQPIPVVSPYDIPPPGDPLSMAAGMFRPRRSPMSSHARDFIMRGGRDGPLFGHFR